MTAKNRTYKHEMETYEVIDLLDKFFKCNLFCLDKIEFANKFMNGDCTKEDLMQLMGIEEWDYTC